MLNRKELEMQRSELLWSLSGTLFLDHHLIAMYSNCLARNVLISKFFYKLQVVVMWRNVQTRYTAFSTAAMFTRRCSSADSMAARASNLINRQRNKGGHNKDYARPVP